MILVDSAGAYVDAVDAVDVTGGVGVVDVGVEGDIDGDDLPTRQS